MRHVLCGLLAVLLLFGAAAVPARAWDGEGHAAVGAIAEALLRPATRQRVAGLLGMRLGVAAAWADCARGVVRQDGRFAYAPRPGLRAACAAFDTAPGRALMERYAAENWEGCGHAPRVTCHAEFHYADIAIQRGGYGMTHGAGDHDVVHAINAAIAVLRGAPAPAPFHIDDARVALLMLAHFVGDIHQPLHVGAVYLDAAGRVVDPDAAPEAAAGGTQGGNLIRMDGQRLHAAWDAMPDGIALPPGEDLVRAAEGVAPMAGPVEGWAAAWAGESLAAARRAFAGLAFGPFAQGGWEAHAPAGYGPMRARIQREQVIKAGARLAQLLNLLLP
jgi:hypothetical protein